MASPRLPFLLLPMLLACPAESPEAKGPTPGEPGTRTSEPAAQRVAPPKPEAPGDAPFFMPPPPEPPARTGGDAPLDLTASDGTGLELVAFEAKGVVEGPLAFTELHLTFRNPEPRVREGRFRVTLPEDASISRFAMKIGEQWQEGEVVERQKARQVYEDFLHRRQDPALLEQAAGNEFTARVFPIPANATKELIVSYSHELSDPAEPYRIPLVGLPMVQRLNIDVVVAKHEAAGAATSLGGTTVRHETVRVAKESWVPDRDFEVRAEAKEGQLALRNDNLVLLRVAPELSAEPDPVHGLMVLVDTSASRALGFAAQGRLLSDLVRGLSRGAGEDTPLLVAGFDQEVAVLFEGAAGGFGAKAQEALNQRRALGASDLEGALAWAAENGNKRYDRLVLITDGVATIGDTEGAGVLAAARSLSDAGVKRMDALALGGLKDADRLHQLVTAGLPRDGVVLDGALPLPELGRRLSRSTTSGLKVAVEGASWVWPQTLDGVQPGDHVLIYADLPAGRPVRATVGGQTVSLSEDRVLSAPRPLLERAWVRARILRLLAQRQDLAGDPDLGEALKHQVIELSTKYRVLSPFTALLVLETEWDYQRYGIARSGLADILTVGAQGVEVLNRTQVAEKPRPTPPTPKPTRPQLRRDAAKGRAAPTAGSGSAEQSPSLAGPADEGGAPAPTEDLGATRGEADAFRAGDGAEEEAKQAESADDMAPAAAAPAAPPAPPAPEPAAAPDPAPRRQAEANEAPMQAERRRESRPRPTSSSAPPPAQAGLAMDKKQLNPALEGELAEVMALLAKDKVAEALRRAQAWREEKPGDVLALVALGEALEKQGNLREAARAYGSIIDLFPTRADLLRFAGYRLDRLNLDAAHDVAVDAYAKAVAQRPDHPGSHRALAMALVKRGEHAAAFDALVYGLAQRYPSRFPGVQRILQEDLALVAAAWTRAAPKDAATIQRRLQEAGGSPESQPSLRFILSWETDANDVDFHIHDARGGHAYYSQPSLGSGGTLYADVTTGYGPECFTIPGSGSAFPYRMEAHYYRKGPMGYGMGRVQIIKHDGKGGLSFDERPFVVMTDGAYLDLGQVTAKQFR